MAAVPSSDALIGALIDFFNDVAKRDQELLKCLRANFATRIGDDVLCFTVPELHSFLSHNISMFDGTDYHSFRRALFNAPINAALSSLGASIVIIENNGKVDRTLYGLNWVQPQG